MISKNGLLKMDGDYLVDYNITTENRNKLIQYLKEDFVKRDNYGFGVHMDDFVVDVDNKINLIKDSLIIYKELVSICKNNNWTYNLIPILNFHLKSVEKISKKSIVKNCKDLIKKISKFSLPEVCLGQKIFYTKTRNSEEYIYPIRSNIFFDLFGKNLFGKDYYFIQYFTRDEECILDNCSYNSYFKILYNENNSETVSNIKRLSFENR